MDSMGFSQSKLGASYLKNELAFSNSNNGTWFQKLNSSAAQRTIMENIFQKNALHNMDSEPIVEETVIRMTASGKQMMEEEKLETQFRRSPNKRATGSIRKSSAPQSGSKRSPQKGMNIEQIPGRDQNSRALQNEDSDEQQNFSPQNQICKGQNSEWDTSPNERQLQQRRSPVASQQVEIKESGSVELIIQPIESIQANNFYCLNENGGRIGRHSNNEIVILEESVSRHHSKIEFQNDKFYLVDIGSTTGTFMKIQAKLVLQENMILELGSNQFLVEEIVAVSEVEGALTLRVIEGMHFNQKFCIRNTASIGRKGNNTPSCIPFADDFHLSNNHAKIDYIEGSFIFEDIGSTNGYVVNIASS